MSLDSLHSPKFVLSVSGENQENHPPVTLSVESKIVGDPKSDRILVIGGGVSGLMTAWILLDKGYPVTIVAKDWAWTKDFQHSRLTSQIAGALWEFPPGSYGSAKIEELETEIPKPGFAGIEDYRTWALQSYEFYSHLSQMQDGKLKTQSGISITKLHQFFYHELSSDTPDAKTDNDKMNAIKNTKIVKEFKSLDSKAVSTLLKELKVGDEWQKKIKSGYTHNAPIINTDKAMVFLMAIVRNKGAEFETRELKVDPESRNPEFRSLAALSRR